MGRMIDADALEKHIADTFGYPAADILHEIATFPTVDTVPVVHGDWVDGRPYVNSRWKVCSVCHQSAPEPHGGYNYRPNCGAKMDLEVKDA